MAQPLDRRKRLPRGFMVSLTAVEVCVSNAERLLNDASKVSPPSSAALAELSIEEAGKAWMLYFRLLFQGRQTKFAPRLSSKERAPVEEYLDAHADYLRKLDQEILEGFRWHRVKLRFLSFLLGYVEIALPLLARKGRLVPLAEAIHGPAFNVKDRPNAANVDGVRDLIHAFRLESLTELSAVKERGLYVNLSRTGDLVSPDVEMLPAPLLMALAAFLILTLKGDLLALSR
jgi:HEPN superfamily AbiV-like protein